MSVEQVTAATFLQSGNRRVLLLADDRRLALVNQTTGMSVHPAILTGHEATVVKFATADQLFLSVDSDGNAEIRSVKVTNSGVRVDKISSIQGVSAAAVVASRSPQHVYVGDKFGVLTAYNKNGTRMKYMQVTESAIIQVAQLSGTVYWLAEHSFGSASMSSLDGSYYACRGWAGSAADFIVEQGATTKVYVVLEDGDVLVFQTQGKKSGSGRSCEMIGKFPRLFYSTPRLAIQGASGYALCAGRAYVLQIQDSNTKVLATHATEATHLVLPPKASGAGIDLQGSFTVLGTDMEVLHATRGKAKAKASVVEGSDGDSGWDNFFLNILEKVPNSLLFGIAVVAAVAWNVRKVNRKRKEAEDSNPFDEDEWKEKFAKKLAERKATQGVGIDPGGSGSLGDLSKSAGSGAGAADMKELMASMKKIREDAASLKTGQADLSVD
jgi:hypothetical protein